MRARSMKVIDLAVRIVATIPMGTPLRECAKTMRAQHVGSLVVVNEANQPVGMLTDRDIAIEVVALNRDIDALKADDIMATPVATATEYEGVVDALARMRELGIRRLPIVDANRVIVGIVTSSNIMEELSVMLDSLVRSVKSSKTREIAQRP